MVHVIDKRPSEAAGCATPRLLETGRPVLPGDDAIVGRGEALRRINQFVDMDAAVEIADHISPFAVAGEGDRRRALAHREAFHASTAISRLRSSSRARSAPAKRAGTHVGVAADAA